MTVPILNPGLPFVPKTARSRETQWVYFFSRHRWVLETEIVTTGAPLTDTFKVHSRIEVRSDEQGIGWVI
jgi:hypothetical protein